MKNNDTNTDYHKFDRVGDQKWEIVDFFFFLPEICIHYFLYREFSFPTYKKQNYDTIPKPKS